MVRQSVLPSFPIGVIFGSSCEHLQNQRNASIQVPPVIKSSCRIPQFSHGRPFVKVNLHCYVRAWATHAVSIISARRFLWCKMTASARIDRVLRNCRLMEGLESIFRRLELCKSAFGAE